MIPHIPPQMGSQYRHAGHEVWYPSKMYDGKYRVCENGPLRNENKRCSRNLWFNNGIDAHLEYMGIAVSEQCRVRQVRGTLLL